MSEAVYTPIDPPAKPAVPPPHKELTDAETKMQQEIQKHFEDPAFILGEKPLMDVEKMWLSYEQILRYLRASKYKVTVAIQRLEATLKWRREYGIYETTPEQVEPEAVTGKEVLFGFDVNGRPALYLMPSRQNTNEPTGQIRFTVWILERCIDLMPEGVESLDLLINYADKAQNPSLSTARAVLSILQDHYPERLGLALILNVPWLLNAFYKLITPFVDPVTRDKMKFNPQVVQDGIFSPDMVMSQWWGGSCNFEYEHDKYWPALVSLCNERTQKWTATWKKLGGTVGIKESDYKTGDSEDVVALASAPDGADS
ncbi:CRAL-TRIO domain-containing protein C23B6.04c [Mycena sanguinolenta]|uniref:CRAL-TRIO domain-containing protein C23B6.04c n=1 Tax=Mycena sanguinolenta TaxID=230812 RepID=A0A8H6Z9J6_9AGAR|nr:CRAL-TRIO domain-containing protein C23B6.04c [Mycena sanguinolenta]